MSQELHFRNAENTFVDVDRQTGAGESIQDLTDVEEMVGQRRAGDENIVKVDEYKRETTEDTIHESLEGLGRIFEPERHPKKLK